MDGSISALRLRGSATIGPKYFVFELGPSYGRTRPSTEGTQLGAKPLTGVPH